MNVYQRMAKVRSSEAVSYIRRDAKVMDYRAVTHDMVTAMSRQAMIDAGVHESLTLVESGLIDTEKRDKNGGKLFMYRAKFEVTFVNVDEPEDRYSVLVEALANDSGDKHCGKAASMAKKLALLKELAIETGENEESRVPEEPVYASPEELQELWALCEEKGVPLKLAETRILTATQAPSLDKLTLFQAAQARDWIHRYASKLGEARNS